MNAQAIRAEYRRHLQAVGRQVWLRRYTGTGSGRVKSEWGPLLARATEFRPDQLVGDVQQGDQHVILLAEDVEYRQFPVPILKGDKLLLNGRETNVEAPDINTRRVGEVLVAYEIRVRG